MNKAILTNIMSALPNDVRGKAYDLRHYPDFPFVFYYEALMSQILRAKDVVKIITSGHILLDDKELIFPSIKNLAHCSDMLDLVYTKDSDGYTFFSIKTNKAIIRLDVYDNDNVKLFFQRIVVAEGVSVFHIKTYDMWDDAFCYHSLFLVQYPNCYQVVQLPVDGVELRYAKRILGGFQIYLSEIYDTSLLHSYFISDRNQSVIKLGTPLITQIENDICKLPSFNVETKMFDLQGRSLRIELFIAYHDWKCYKIYYDKKLVYTKFNLVKSICIIVSDGVDIEDFLYQNQSKILNALDNMDNANNFCFI